MLSVVPTLDVSQEPTHGQLDNGTTTLISEDWRPDDGVLHVGHEKYSVSSEKGQGELMGSIHCTRIPFILITTNQSHLSPLSRPYSADPPIDPKTHTGTGTVELFFVIIFTTPYAYKTHVLCLALFFVTIMSYHTFFCDYDVFAYYQPHSGSAAYTLPIVIYF